MGVNYVNWPLLYKCNIIAMTIFVQQPSKEVGMRHPNGIFMVSAIAHAMAVYISRGDHPVGAVIVYQDEIIADEANAVHLTGDRLNHAEVMAINEALAWKRDNGLAEDLSDCVMYVTHEPCINCLKKIAAAKLGMLVYGTSVEHILLLNPQPKFKIFQPRIWEIYHELGHVFYFWPNFFAEECSMLLEMLPPKDD